MRTWLAAALLGLLLAGCGGGDDSPAPIGAPDSAAIEAVRARNQTLDAALIAGDVDRIMSFYSDAYTDGAGLTLDQYRQDVVQALQTVSILQIDPVEEVFVPNADGTVDHLFRARIALRFTATGRTSVREESATDRWTNEGGTWRQTYSTGSGFSAALGLPPHSASPP